MGSWFIIGRNAVGQATSPGEKWLSSRAGNKLSFRGIRRAAPVNLDGKDDHRFQGRGTVRPSL